MRYLRQMVNDNYDVDISLIGGQFGYEIDEDMFSSAFRNG